MCEVCVLSDVLFPLHWFGTQFRVFSVHFSIPKCVDFMLKYLFKRSETVYCKAMDPTKLNSSWILHRRGRLSFAEIWKENMYQALDIIRWTESSPHFFFFYTEPNITTNSHGKPKICNIYSKYKPHSSMTCPGQCIGCISRHWAINKQAAFIMFLNSLDLDFSWSFLKHCK